jgi:hypothetical protein
MDSKKLGIFAAAALTVLATQANANPKQAAKAEGEMVCSNGCAVAGKHECAGHELKAEKTEKACLAAKGKWMAKKDVKAAAPAATDPAAAPAADKAHKH